MAWIEHDGTERRGGEAGQTEARSRVGGVRWLRERLLRALRREGAVGLLTMSLDGKLHCQTWKAERRQPDCKP
jgi:hypothetical protein